jgi:hypothetical protein
MNGLKIACAVFDIPIAIPNGIPIKQASRNAARIRYKLVPTCSINVDP